MFYNYNFINVFKFQKEALSLNNTFFECSVLYVNSIIIIMQFGYGHMPHYFSEKLNK